jgi:hypothetical protein
VIYYGEEKIMVKTLQPAAAVSVVGDFNEWNPFAHPLRVRANRTRSARTSFFFDVALPSETFWVGQKRIRFAVTVPSGSRLRFRYLAEGGRWFNDDTLSPGQGEDAIIAV